jgi:hypothetical protein
MKTKVERDRKNLNRLAIDKYPHIKAHNDPSISAVTLREVDDCSANTCRISNTPAPAVAGMESKKENRAAASL